MGVRTISKFIIALALSGAISGCSLVKNGKLNLSAIVADAECNVDPATGKAETVPCALNASALNEKWIYSVPNGARGEMQQETLTPVAVLDETASSYVLRSSMPTGWASGALALPVALPAALTAANIKRDVTLFGVTGSYDVSKVICSANPSSERCWMSSDKYAYSSAFNGRSQTCTVNGTTAESAACYADNPGEGRSGVLYLISPGAIPSTCSVSNGLIQLASGKTECMVPLTKYYYTDVNGGGGRQTNCSSTSVKIDSACWFNPCVTTNGVTTCSSVQMNMNGTTVSKSCAIDTTTANSAVCQVIATPPASPKWVYTERFGGRMQLRTNGTEIYCDANNNSAPCFLNASSKTSFTGLTPNKIKANVSVFGMFGTLFAAGEWGSGAARAPGIGRIDLSVESSARAGASVTPDLPAGYHEVPLFKSPEDVNLAQIDDDGSGVQKVDRVNWGSTTCGRTGSLESRIADCGAKLPGATWDGDVRGNAGQGKWRLVSRAGANKEVWRDESTLMLWSSLVSESLNWCKATGSSNSQNPGVEAALVENDPDDICDNSTYQNNGSSESVVAACFEATGFTGTDSAIRADGKVGLGLSSTPSVFWRLPTLYDYQVAEYNGIRFVLPDIGFHRAGQSTLLEWTGTLNSLSSLSEEAWSFDSKEGDEINSVRTAQMGARCIGR